MDIKALVAIGIILILILIALMIINQVIQLITSIKLTKLRKRLTHYVKEWDHPSKGKQQTLEDLAKGTKWEVNHPEYKSNPNTDKNKKP